MQKKQLHSSCVGYRAVPWAIAEAHQELPGSYWNDGFAVLVLSGSYMRLSLYPSLAVDRSQGCLHNNSSYARTLLEIRAFPTQTYSCTSRALLGSQLASAVSRSRPHSSSLSSRLSPGAFEQQQASWGKDLQLQKGGWALGTTIKAK